MRSHIYQLAKPKHPYSKDVQAENSKLYKIYVLHLALRCPGVPELKNAFFFHHSFTIPNEG